VDTLICPGFRVHRTGGRPGSPRGPPARVRPAPFPAQGQTTDTAHLIIAEHATQEGSYVALTRAREQTHIHAASPAHEASDGDRLQALSGRMSRTEPDLPSIHTPLAHEADITNELARIDIESQDNRLAAPLTAEPSPARAPIPREPATSVTAANETDVGESAGPRNHQPTRREPHPESSPEFEPAANRRAGETLEQQRGGAWPRNRQPEPATPDLTDDQIEAIHRRQGWEP
jgi:ATP-dependent exoDNAse (exonuclease V) beta subunit